MWLLRRCWGLIRTFKVSIIAFSAPSLKFLLILLIFLSVKIEKTNIIFLCFPLNNQSGQIKCFCQVFFYQMKVLFAPKVF